MFGSLVITALLASSVLVRADPSPSTPGPGAVYNAGAQCPIAWAVDSTGIWKVMNIQLMTGDNTNMIPLTTVTTVDGTNPSNNSFSWTCPEVIPNSAIYFYQFTSPASNNTLWTTRFATPSSSGATTPPPQSTQPDGQAIAWGKGALANPADAQPPPTGASPSSASGTVPVGTTSSPSTPLTASSAIVTSSLPVVATPSTSGSTSTSGTTTGGASTISTTSGVGSSAGNSNAAMTALSIDGRIFQAMIALGAAAVGFTTVL